MFSLNDLPLQLIAGALLTFAVTQSAELLGSRWSGILAVFPVIGSVLAIFTHRSQGAAAVAQLYRGMVKGLCSLSLFFFILTLSWQHYGFWLPVSGAIARCIALQFFIHIKVLIKSARFS